jgi:hypothetical protein
MIRDAVAGIEFEAAGDAHGASGNGLAGANYSIGHEGSRK